MITKEGTPRIPTLLERAEILDKAEEITKSIDEAKEERKKFGSASMADALKRAGF